MGRFIVFAVRIITVSLKKTLIVLPARVLLAVGTATIARARVAKCDCGVEKHADAHKGHGHHPEHDH
jgi:hypothetical protein